LTKCWRKRTGRLSEKKILGVILYAAESWKVTKGIYMQMLDVFSTKIFSGEFYESTGPTQFRTRNFTIEQACSPSLSNLNAAGGDRWPFM